MNKILIGLVCFFLGCAAGLAQPGQADFPHRKGLAVIPQSSTSEHYFLSYPAWEIDHLRDKQIRLWLTLESFEDLHKQGWAVEWVPPMEYLSWWDRSSEEKTVLSTPLTTYPTYTEIGADLADLESTYPTLCRRISLGKSSLNRDLWALHLGDQPDSESDEPEVKLISTIHGNETVGTVLLINLIHLLLSEYGTTARITELLDNTDIWIVPLMNPDGYSQNPRTRWNQAGVDLNRDFPDRITDPINTPDGRQPETAQVMAFNESHSFVLSANFHTGEVVVNYPWDSSPVSPNPPPKPEWHTPDDDAFIASSLRYALNNPTMASSTDFPDGITNGIAWYTLYGGMQDWNYNWYGCQEVTIELSTVFSPSPKDLLDYWNNNRESLLAYLESVHRGIHGVVRDHNTRQPLSAEIRVVGPSDRIYPVKTDPAVGDYHRLLQPGTYDLRVTAVGYSEQQINGVVVNEATATRLDIDLERHWSTWRFH